MRALYISQNGMLEPLGQSQVLPYVRGLARRGIEYDLISYEMADADPEAIRALQEKLQGEGIRYSPLSRARDPRLRTKLMEASRGVAHTLATVARRPPAIVHGRSYIPTAIGDALSTMLPRARLLFDCRGMLGDEYVDSGYWAPDRIEYKLLKTYEKRIFRRADGVVVLTHALRRWLLESGLLGKHTRLDTIPTCVDLTRFHFDAEKREQLRQELGWSERLVLVYSGSLGGMYCDVEIARLAAILKRRAGRPFGLLCLTRSTTVDLVKELHAGGVTDDEIAIRSVKPVDMAAHLSAGDAGVAFGKQCFARLGCSPTKLAEYFACGLPAIVNDFGDQVEVAKERDVCVLTESFDDAAMTAAADRLLALANAPLMARTKIGHRVAEARFGVETVGITRYEAMYRDLASR
jgi:glycosyltransferase involved in cell wall biosynthesis